MNTIAAFSFTWVTGAGYATPHAVAGQRWVLHCQFGDREQRPWAPGRTGFDRAPGSHPVRGRSP
ncbi:hypothetical protein, partial [Streptomyces buecherae]|uniref:hypothetical protein n=1 Tax=Streptomyces buecherae TaxID=2763006 RepID=UPI001C9A9B69